jgi:hypothetical protein
MAIKTIKRSSKSSDATITIITDGTTDSDVLYNLMNSNRTNRKTLKNDPKRII